MMKSKKGFTLIELLAVIVILAIIALIAVPIILNIIGDAKSSSNERSIELYADAVEKAVAIYPLNNDDKIFGSFTTEDGKTLTNDDDSLTIDYKGKVVCDTIQIYESGKIYLKDCKVNDILVEGYEYGKKEIIPVSFKDDSWETIVKAVEQGKTSAYKVGDTKEITLTGEVAGTYTIRIANKTNTGDVCTKEYFEKDGTKETYSKTACGFVIEFEDSILLHKMNTENTNVGGWEKSEMRTYVNSDIYNALPPELKNIIIDTTVVSGHGSKDSSNFTTEDKLYLLSTKEIYGDGINYDTAEENTRQLDYYKTIGVTTSNYSGTIKKNEGKSNYWWTRSIKESVYYHFYGIEKTGEWYAHYANNTFGVAPAFRIG